MCVLVSQSKDSFPLIVSLFLLDSLSLNNVSLLVSLPLCQPLHWSLSLFLPVLGNLYKL